MQIFDYKRPQGDHMAHIFKSSKYTQVQIQRDFEETSLIA